MRKSSAVLASLDRGLAWQTEVIRAKTQATLQSEGMFKVQRMQAHDRSYSFVSSFPKASHYIDKFRAGSTDMDTCVDEYLVMRWLACPPRFPRSRDLQASAILSHSAK